MPFTSSEAMLCAPPKANATRLEWKSLDFSFEEKHISPDFNIPSPSSSPPNPAPIPELSSPDYHLNSTGASITVNFADGTFHSLLPASSALHSLDPNLRIYGAAGHLIQQGVEAQDAFDQAKAAEQERRRNREIFRASVCAAQQAGTIATATASASGGSSCSGAAGRSGGPPGGGREAVERATMSLRVGEAVQGALQATDEDFGAGVDGNGEEIGGSGGQGIGLGIFGIGTLTGGSRVQTEMEMEMETGSSIGAWVESEPSASAPLVSYEDSNMVAEADSEMIGAPDETDPDSSAQARRRKRDVSDIPEKSMESGRQKMG